MRALPFLLLIACSNAWAQASDSLRIYRQARQAEAEYERAARRLAPIGTSSRSGTCDEYVGRFCLYYDAGRDPLPAEPPEIKRIREQTLLVLKAAFALNPARTATAFPLIRLLLDNHEPRPALEIARRFQEASPDAATAAMLLALTSHAAGEITPAEKSIEAWLAAVDAAERRRLTDLRWLLTSEEEKRYRALGDAGRAAYERLFWRYADALFLTPGNEIRTEHFARHAESRLIEAAPTVLGSTSWGNDVAELTIRYGSVKARTRRWPPPMGSSDLGITEHWDPEQVSYAPPAIDTLLRTRARPANGWPLDTVRSVSGHAPPTIRRMLPLEHQANVFRDPAAGLVLRVDGVVAADSAASSGGTYRAGLFVATSDLTLLNGVAGAGAYTDSLVLRLELPLPPAAALYSAEILEWSSRLAARARFAIERPVPDRGLSLSTILIAEPFTAGRLPASRNDGVAPYPSLVLPASRSFGVYAEVELGNSDSDSVRVELELKSIDGAPALLRAARWLGQKLGVGDRPAPTRLTWSAEVAGGAPTALAVTVDPGNLKAGRYIVEMAVTSEGRRAVSRRELLFSASEKSSRQP